MSSRTKKRKAEAATSAETASSPRRSKRKPKTSSNLWKSSAKMTKELPTSEQRIKGVIYGVCVGDALGGPVQFQKRGTFEPVNDLRPIDHFKQPAGSWSDDGSLTLCLAQSLIDTSGKFSASDYITKFLAWRDSGYYSSASYAWDVGMATNDACRIWSMKSMGGKVSPSDVVERQKEVDKSLKRERFSGNGSLMRVAPVGAALWERPHEAMRVAREQSDLTHPYSVNGDACALYTLLMCRAMKGGDKAGLATMITAADISDRTLRERLARYRDLEAWNVPSDEIKATGWVIDTLEAALWAFFTTDNWRDGAIKVVNLGDDSDSTGAVYGGLAGAYYGLEAIPQAWRDGLVKEDLVQKVADGLCTIRQAHQSGDP